MNIENGVPVACECPSETYQDGTCKHRVAVAIREPVLEAAITDNSQDRVATDGGKLVVASNEGEVLETDDVDETNAETEDCACSTLSVCHVLHLGGKDVARQGGRHPQELIIGVRRVNPLFKRLSVG